MKVCLPSFSRIFQAVYLIVPTVRTPLNAIVNYLETALDGSLDGETREALTKSYVASKSLVHVINDLLVRYCQVHRVHSMLTDCHP